MTYSIRTDDRVLVAGLTADEAVYMAAWFRSEGCVVDVITA